MNCWKTTEPIFTARRQTNDFNAVRPRQLAKISPVNMTWKEFKEYIEKYLKDNDVPGDIEIEFIDFSWPGPGDFEEGFIAAHVDRDRLSIC